MSESDSKTLRNMLKFITGIKYLIIHRIIIIPIRPKFIHSLGSVLEASRYQETTIKSYLLQINRGPAIQLLHLIETKIRYCIHCWTRRIWFRMRNKYIKNIFKIISSNLNITCSDRYFNHIVFLSIIRYMFI